MQTSSPAAPTTSRMLLKTCSFAFIVTCVILLVSQNFDLSSIFRNTGQHSTHYLRVDEPSLAVAKNGMISIQGTPPKLAIVIPFFSLDAHKVVKTLQRWSEVGDPCPLTKMLPTKTVDVLFWFNQDFRSHNNAKFAAAFHRNVTRALRPIRQCFGEVIYGSAMLSEEEDRFPRGPTIQWYNLFLSPLQPLRKYAYVFRSEHDVYPIRGGWVDALLSEVTFRGDFFVKGSIHRGEKYKEIVSYPSSASWITHINGNALYKANDPQFNSMIASCASEDQDVADEYLATFDVALWKKHVTSYTETWPLFQSYAHKFQYTDLIISYNDDVSKEKITSLLNSSPNTFFLHGSSDSASDLARLRQKIQREVADNKTKVVKPVSISDMSGEASAVSLKEKQNSPGEKKTPSLSMNLPIELISRERLPTSLQNFVSRILD